MWFSFFISRTFKVAHFNLLACVPWPSRGSQRITNLNCSSPSAMWIPGIELQSPGLAGRVVTCCSVSPPFLSISNQALRDPHTGNYRKEGYVGKSPVNQLLGKHICNVKGSG